MEKTRILLVDDEAEFRESTARVLARRGFEVRTADRGEAALLRVAEEVPDLVLLDLKMEGLGGLGTLKRLREAHPDLPVVILTGHGDVPSAMAGIRLDVTDFLQKPVEPDVLAARMRAILARESHAPLRERSVAELMVPAASYRRIRAEASVKEALALLKTTAGANVTGRPTEKGHRSILVVDRSGRLVGVLRGIDVLEMLEPAYLRDSPYAGGYTGMFLARCKVFGDRPVGDFLDPDSLVAITESTPLMEALALMTKNRLINLPVLRGEEVVGVLRDRDLFLEVVRLVLGE